MKALILIICLSIIVSEVLTLKRNLGIASLLLIGVTFILKVSGLLRDMTIAFYFGDSYLADAYIAAFIIPNMLFLFMTNGMKNALVPSYVDAVENDSGKKYLNQVLKGTAVISLALSLLGVVLAPFIVRTLYSGFSDEAVQISTVVTIILFSSLFFVGLNSVFEAYFDAEKRFSLSIFSQVIVVLSTILGAVLLSGELSVYSLAYGYLAGTIISLLFKIPILKNDRIMEWKRKIDWTEVKKFYAIFIPVALTVMVGQINLTVDNVFASRFSEGAVTYINYAKNLVHFPQQIFGIAIATVIFPMLAKAMSNNNNNLFKKGIEEGLNAMYLIVLPSIIGMMLLMPNIVELLYQRGEFSSGAVENTAIVSYYYFGSVLFFSLNNVINKGFYTLKKGHLILIIGGISVLLNILFNYIFTSLIGYNGIPLASSFVGLFYAGICYIVFSKLIGGMPHLKIVVEFIKITGAAAIMAGCILFIHPLITGWTNIFQIGLIGIVGALVYGGALLLLRAKSVNIIIKRFKKKE